MTRGDGDGIPRRVKRETTDQLTARAFPYVRDAGNAEPVETAKPRDAIEQLAGHFLRKGRKSSWLATAVVAALFGTGGFFGMQAAGDRRDEKISDVEADAAIHGTLPAHRGAATKAELQGINKRVQELDTSVGTLGTKIDGQEARQQERHDDIKEELRYLRRHRRNQ